MVRGADTNGGLIHLHRNLETRVSEVRRIFRDGPRNLSSKLLGQSSFYADRASRPRAEFGLRISKQKGHSKLCCVQKQQNSRTQPEDSAPGSLTISQKSVSNAAARRSAYTRWRDNERHLPRARSDPPLGPVVVERNAERWRNYATDSRNP